MKQRIWVAYLDCSYEGLEMISLHHTREGAKAACEAREGEVEWEEDYTTETYSEGWGRIPVRVVAVEVDE